MFFDIGPLELIALIVIAVLVFGPDKLPKVIQDVSGFIRKVRQFSDNAKEDIRSELGPEFKDFEFEDLNPKNFARKHLLDNEDLGLNEIRSSLDLRKEMSDFGDEGGASGKGGGGGVNGSGGRTSLTKGETGERAKTVPLGKDEPPPFDADAT